VDSGNDKDDFIYCLPDNKEISVCREMMKNMGYPKLELGLSVMPKDDLADSLAYNSLKVHILFSYEIDYICSFSCYRYVLIYFLLLGLDYK
jgi:hypothetical protein